MKVNLEKFYALVNFEGSEERKRKYLKRREERLRKRGGMTIEEEIKKYKQEKGE